MTRPPRRSIRSPRGRFRTRARNTWVTETALGTALNTSYFAENVALFSIVMGAALLLTGIGFLVVTLGLLGTAARKEEEVASPEPTASPAVAV